MLLSNAKKQVISLLQTEKNQNQSVIWLFKHEFKLTPSFNFDHIKPVEGTVLENLYFFLNPL